MLPIFQAKEPVLSLLQTKWASLLNPVLDNPILNGRIIAGKALSSGDNVIDHGLGRPLIGWLVIRQYSAFYGLYDKQAANITPELTLILNAAGATTVDLWVF